MCLLVNNLNRRWTSDIKEIQRFVYTDFLSLDSLTLVIRMPGLAPWSKKTPFKGKICSPHERRQGKAPSALLALAVCQVTFIKTNQYAMVGYFGANFHGPQQTSALKLNARVF